MGNYKLVEWPESQNYMGLEDFDEHASLADCEKFGSCAYFIDSDWLAEVEM